MSKQSYPVLADVDLLIFGSSVAAVVAAEEGRGAGLRVLVISDLPYFGAETAGALRLWPDLHPSEDPLIRKCFPSQENAVAPGKLKRVLEQRLLDLSIPFLYLARPVALMRNENGETAGVAFVARTALFVVRCRGLIDCSRQGLLARLQDVPLREVTPLPFVWNILTRSRPDQWPGLIEEILPPFAQTQEEASSPILAYSLQFHATMLEQSFRDPCAAAHLARAALPGGEVLVAADLLVEDPWEQWDSKGEPADHPSDLPDEALHPSAGLWLASPILPLTPEGARSFWDAGVSVEMGRRIGKLAAKELADLPPSRPVGRAAGKSATHPMQFLPAFLRSPIDWVEASFCEFPDWERRDVVVAGGGTAGAPAGIASARAGASTLVLEAQNQLGGVGTTGLISSYWFGNKTGFTAKLNEAVSSLDSVSAAKNGNTWSPEAKVSVYHRMLQEAGGTAWLRSFVCGVRVENGKLSSVLISTPYGAGVVRADAFVDATGNADLAAAAGAPCRVIDARHVAVQGTGLSPRNRPEVRHQNSDHTFVDECDPEGITHAHVHARAKYTDHFDNTNLVNSRERRQIIGDLEVSPLDLLAERTFPDTVFTARSNFDTHGFVIHPVFMVTAPDHKPLQAHVPYRCMLPKNVDGLLVTGLGMSAHRDALPVIRMQADLQNQGFAAGLAAAMAAENGTNLRQLDIRRLQEQLVSLGILEPEVASHTDSFPLDAETICLAAKGELTNARDVAIVFAHLSEARPVLIERVEKDQPGIRKENAALILGLQGDASAAQFLLEWVAGSEWDDGWNYRGMGQFGASMSRLDAAIIALARTRSPGATAVVATKIGQLDGDATFSHCRAVALAACILRAPSLSDPLVELLNRPTMQGHVQRETKSVLDTANSNTTETESRNLALRELYLARGLLLCGDRNSLGRSILEGFKCDLRGHFARHATAILEPGAPDISPLEVA